MTSASNPDSRTRRLATSALALLVLVACIVLAGSGEAGAAKKPPNKPGAMEQPNIVMIMTDDQASRTEIPEAMPNLFDKLVPKGTQYTDYVVTTPLCCPSRAAFMTGQYGHNNGVLRNVYGDLKEPGNVLPTWLQRAGYNTAHVGKFLNAYEANIGGPAAVAPGWDLWFTQLEKRRYYQWKASKNGEVRHYGSDDSDHATAVTNAFATRWTKRLVRKDAPFYMQVDQYAPHTSTGRDSRCAGGPVPEPRDEHRFDTYAVPQQPNYNEEDVSDKPPSVRERTLLTPEETADIERRYRCTLEALYGVDRGIGDIVDVLKNKGELNNTVFFVTSDNGLFYGEHRIPKGKPSPYEENVSMPLTVVVPPKYRDRSELVATTNQPTANIDLAPTMLELADAEPCRSNRNCRTMDGRSLMPLMDGSGRWPNPRAIGFELGECDFRGVRYESQVLFQYATETDVGGCEPTGTEFYDLINDPFQLGNLASLDQYAANESNLKNLTAQIGDCAGLPNRDPEPESGHYCQ